MTPGFHQMPMEKYLSDPCIAPSLNSSIAQILLSESPRKVWFCHPRLNLAFRGREETKFDIGTSAHALLLEGQNVMEILEFDDYRTKEARIRRDAARAAGRVPLLKKHSEAVMGMVLAANEFIRNSEVAEYWENCDAELVGISEERGVWLRCRFDRITKNRRFLFDYKSTEDASPEAFSRQITRMGYHIQEAFYRRIARNLGATGPRFVFLAQSVEPPHECSLHGCDPALQEIADFQVERAICMWRECVQKKQWPSYGGRIHWAIPPTYMMNEYEMRLQEAA